MAGRNLFAEDAQPVTKGRNLFAGDSPDGPETADNDDLKKQIGDFILNTPGGAELAEFGSAVSRGTTGIVDFFATKPINAALELSGVDAKIPKLTEKLEPATKGNFVEPGLLKDTLRTSGEFVGPAGAFGAAVKTAARAVPAVQAVTQSVGQGVTKQLGASTAVQDLTGAALSGAGFEAGGEVGEKIAGEKGRKVGEFVGAIAAPLSPTVINHTAKSLFTPGAKTLLKEATPTIKGLKEAARTVYKEIDELGAVVGSGKVTSLTNQVKTLAAKEGFNKRIHPKVSAVLDEFNAAKGVSKSVGELDTLRKVAQSAARSIEPEEKRLGSLLVSKIDDFMDNLNPSDFQKGGGDVGSKFKDARQLWKRAKKSELIEEAFSKAGNQASGFENGIRVQFRSILNNKKKLSGFSSEEIKAMRKVVQGGKAENLAKLIGKFGFSEGQATNMLMGSAGVFGGAAVGGPVGAVAVPLIGQLSKSLAQKLTKGSAEAANLIVRAGKNPNEIVKAYLKAIPKSQRNSQELSELLLRPDIAINKINKKFPVSKDQEKLISDAVFFANFVKSEAQEVGPVAGAAQRAANE